MSAPRGNGYRAQRFTTRLLAFLDAEVPTLPHGELRTSVERFANQLADAHGLPGIGEVVPGASLHEAREELLARLAEAGVEPFEPLSADHWKIVGAGLPFTIDELEDASAASARLFIADTNGRPPIVIAQMFTACGMVKGAIAAHWRR